MAQRTQMRLHAITGSLTAINNGIANADVTPVGSSDAFAENMLEAMGHIAGAIKRIHGNSDFLAEDRGVFTHATSQFIGVLSASSDLKAGGALDIALGADIGGASDLHGAVHAFSTLNVDAEATLASAVVQDLTSGRVVLAGTGGAIEDSASLTFNGSALAVIGAVSGSGNFTVGGNLEVNGTSTLGGSLTIEAGADLIVQDLTNGRVALVGAAGALIDDAQITHSAGQLTVSGSTFSKDVSIVQDLTVGRNLSAVSGSFSGDLTIAGDLVVNGTTVTVNTTELLVEDNMVVINKNETGAGVTAGTAGIEIERGSADNAIVQWLESADKFELKVGAAYADLKIDDLEAVDGTFSGDISAVNASLTGDLTAVSGSFSGDVDVAGGLTVGSIKIDGDTATRLYIVDADGSMKDEVKLRFDGSELLVDAHLDVSGSSDLRGAVHMFSSLMVEQNGDFNGNLWVSGISELQNAVKAYDTFEVVSLATFSAAINLNQAADQSILKTGGDLYMSASADLRLQAGGAVKFVDQYRAASTWSDAEGIKLSNSAAEWSNFEATFGSEVSLLAALVGGGSGGKFVEAVDYTGTIVSASLLPGADGVSDFSAKWPSIVEPRVLKTDIFVNGQLMVSGSGMDYAIDSVGNITFTFSLVPDDMVVVKIG